MARKDTKNMSLSELKALRKEVDAAIADYAERKRKEALKALEAVAKDHGMSVEEIVGTAKKRKKAKAPAKYANPADKSQTWSGRGRQPQWYKDAIAGGAAPESLAI